VSAVGVRPVSATAGRDQIVERRRTGTRPGQVQRDQLIYGDLQRIKKIRADSRGESLRGLARKMITRRAHVAL
jgi:hypothetical protein